MQAFGYSRPDLLADAVGLLSADPEAKVLAGGQTYIPVLKQRFARPSMIVDIGDLGLTGITMHPDQITIGAMTCHAEVSAHLGIKAMIPGLSTMASCIGDRAVRNRGTIGGSLANNDPAACYPAAVLALGGTVRTNARSLAADDFFQGMFTTALAHDEIISSVDLPIPKRSAYAKFRNPASRYAIVGVFVAKFPWGVRVAVTGAGQGGVFRHTGFEKALSLDYSPQAITDIVTSPDGLNGDLHASAEYRAHLINVMARRAVAAS